MRTIIGSWTVKAATFGLVTGLLGGVSASAAEGNPPDGAPPEAARLEEKARRLKQEGDHEGAQRIMREVEEIRSRKGTGDGVVVERIERVERRGPGPGGDSAEAADQERREIERNLEAGRAKHRRLEAMIRDSESNAREVERYVDKLERRRAELNRSGGPSDRAPQEPGRRGGPGPMADERLEHLKVAADHLRAAGFPDAAERVARQADELRRRSEAGERPGPRRDGRGGSLEEPARGPRAGFAGPGSGEGPDDVRAALRRMNRRLERLEAELRGHPRDYPERK